MSNVDNAVESAPTPREVTRDSIRAKILSTKKPKFKVIDFFGEKIEIRQATLGKILAAQERAVEDRQAAMIDILVSRAFVPGTDILVFEDTDAEVLLQLPFGADFQRVTQALEELNEVNFPQPSGNSSDAPPN